LENSHNDYATFRPSAQFMDVSEVSNVSLLMNYKTTAGFKDNNRTTCPDKILRYTLFIFRIITEGEEN
jgi:hypothetical protein